MVSDSGKEEQPTDGTQCEHTDDCPNQSHVGYVCALIECPNCGTHGWHPTKVCKECEYSLCWCVETESEKMNDATPRDEVKQ